MKRQLTALALALTALAVWWLLQPGPCPDGTLAELRQESPCTVGDKVFDFRPRGSR